MHPGFNDYIDKRSSPKSKCSKITFTFSPSDPSFTSVTNIINNSVTNYISQVFINCPIYCNGIVIGYKTAVDTVQQVGAASYIVVINSTYVLNCKGSITTQYVFTNTTNTPIYPIGTVAVSKIISGTGCFLNKQGIVKLTVLADNTRKVKIEFF